MNWSELAKYRDPVIEIEGGFITRIATDESGDAIRPMPVIHRKILTQIYYEHPCGPGEPVPDILALTREVARGG